MLARPHRLTRGSDYRQVVRRGARCGGARLVTSVLVTADGDRAARFGFIISKQVGNAVIRNTVRRRLKAVCAQLVSEIPQGTDVVIRALPACATASFADLETDVRRCISRLVGSVAG